MNSEEYEMLESACKAAATSQPELQRRLKETAGESAESIQKEIVEFLGAVWRDRASVRDTADQALQPLLLLFDMALLQVCDLSHFGFQNTGRARIVWPSLTLPRRPSPNSTFYVLSANLAQSMQAFRLLIIHGFESQARAAFRSVTEIAEIMTLVLADEATYREYLNNYRLMPVGSWLFRY